MSDTKKYTKKNPPKPNDKNIEATKYYVFSETGNIMLASTTDKNDSIQESVREVFAECSVFFATMTKALSTAINPKTNMNYSIYDYTAMQQIIDGSGLFIHVTAEDVSFETSSTGVDFSTKLLESLIGLATGEGELSFAQTMISSMGESTKTHFGKATKSNEEMLGNIIFVCEYLLGMPVISALVCYIDLFEKESNFSVGPCISGTQMTNEWYMHKDTYMFVTPKFVEQYSGDLLSAEESPEFNELVTTLINIIEKKSEIFDVYNNTKPSSLAPSALFKGDGYTITGANLGSAGTLTLKDHKLTISEWSENTINFVADTTVDELLPIIVKKKTTRDGKVHYDPIGSTPRSFQIIPKPTPPPSDDNLDNGDGLNVVD